MAIRPAKLGPLENLLALVSGMVGSHGKRGARQAELCRFLDGLSERDTTSIAKGIAELPEAQQRQVHRTIVTHAYWLSGDGPAGAGAPLLKALEEALNAQVDSFPDPGPTNGSLRSAEEWRASYASHLAVVLIQHGWPEALGRAAAEDLTRLSGPERTIERWAEDLVEAGALPESAAAGVKWAHDLGRFYAKSSQNLGRDLDDVMVADLIERGMSAEDAKATSTAWRRDRKWLAATDAVLPAKILADKRSTEDVLRKNCRTIAKHADRVAAVLAGLVLETKPDRSAASLRDDGMGKLTLAISAAIPHSPTIFQLVQRDHPGASGSPYQWFDGASAVDDLVDAIAEGATPGGALGAARAVKAIADEARTWADALSRGRGRPTKPGVDAAVALEAKGLSPPQIAMVLDRHGFGLDGSSPAEAARQAVKMRRLRLGTK